MSKATYIAIEEVGFIIGGSDEYSYKASNLKYDIQPIGDTFTLIDDSEEQEIEHFHLLFDVVLGFKNAQEYGDPFGISDLINAFKTSTVEFFPAPTTDGQHTYTFVGYDVNLDLKRTSLLSAKEIGILEYGTLLKMKTKTPVTALPDWMNF